MSEKHLTETSVYDASEIREARIRDILKKVDEALKERGYNSVNQIAGYLISNDPAYISSHKNARVLIQEVERFELIEELVRSYLNTK